MNCTDYNPKEYCYISLCVNRKLPNYSGVSLFAENISDFVYLVMLLLFIKKGGTYGGTCYVIIYGILRYLKLADKKIKVRKPRIFGLFYGRGRRARTLGTRFWRPLLYQLSYTPIFKWWAIRDSNPGPTGYEPVALTN